MQEDDRQPQFPFDFAFVTIVILFTLTLILWFIILIKGQFPGFPIEVQAEQGKTLFTYAAAGSLLLALLSDRKKHQTTKKVGLMVSAIAGFLYAWITLDPITSSEPVIAAIVVLTGTLILIAVLQRWGQSISRYETHIHVVRIVAMGCAGLVSALYVPFALIVLIWEAIPAHLQGMAAVLLLSVILDMVILIAALNVLYQFAVTAPQIIYRSVPIRHSRESGNPSDRPVRIRRHHTKMVLRAGSKIKH